MEIKELICTSCPLGCMLKATMEGGKVVAVEGNTCKRGEVYAHKELTNPTRIVTSVVRIKNGTIAMLPVKTDSDIPKGQVFECLKALKGVTVKAPVNIGDIIVKNVVGDTNIVATKSIMVLEDFE